MKRAEMADPVVRGVVLVREATEILGEYANATADSDDRAALYTAAEELIDVAEKLEVDFGVFL